MVLIKSNHSLTFFAFKRPLSSRERAVKPSNNPLPFSLSFSVVGSSDLSHCWCCRNQETCCGGSSNRRADKTLHVNAYFPSLKSMRMSTFHTDC